MKNFYFFSVLMMILFGCSSFLGDGPVDYNWGLGLGVVVIAIGIGVAIYYFFFRKKKRNILLKIINPETPGGVSDKDIRDHFIKLAGKYLPAGTIFKIGKIWKGRATGRAYCFDFQKKRNKILLDYPVAYAAEIIIKGQYQWVYVRQLDGCVLIGRSNFHFDYREIVNLDGSVTPFEELKSSGDYSSEEFLEVAERQLQAGNVFEIKIVHDEKNGTTTKTIKGWSDQKK